MTVIKYSQAIRDAIAEEMRIDQNVFVMGQDVETMGGVFGCTKGILEEFGHDRIRNTPISEAVIIGAGVGGALTGTRMLVEMQYVDFILHAMDQTINQAAKVRYMTGGKATVPLIIRAQQGSGRGNGAQHSQNLEALFCHMPGLKVVMPSTPYDAKGLLKTAVRDNNPVLFFEHKVLYNTKGEVPDTDYTIPFGKADIKRSGKDVTVIATSWMVLKALEAAEILEKQGIDAEIIDPRTLVPLDKETIINSVKKTGRAVIVHEAHEVCGIGAEIAFIIMELAIDWLDAPVKRVTSAQAPIPYSSKLEKLTIPSVDRIIDAVKEVMYIK
ncbi:MAG: alpha-ketoacid dehydrogenase subunit beta [Ignavibacteriaceae bacterium]|nr:alpha-ketoacid dehydrogenase subunit beta [Ignavibacteriaceae bacterium]